MWPASVKHASGSCKRNPLLQVGHCPQHTAASSTRQSAAHGSQQHTAASSTRRPAAHGSQQHTAAARRYFGGR